MLKLKQLTPIKFALCLVIVLGISMFLSGGKAYAAWSCPSSVDAVPSNWGIQDHGLQHNFASLTVYAQVYGDPNHPLNITYRLNSDVTRGYNYGPPPAGLKNKSLYPSARIFTYAGTGEDGQIDVNGRTNTHQFRTGETLTSPAGHCDGWDELGPGNSQYIGNGFVLDCEEIDVNNIPHNNHFWIDQVSTPAGDAGRYGGYWEVKISSSGAFTRSVPFPMNYDGDPSHNKYNSNDLQITNGDNARINLIWHGNQPQPPNPTSNGRCAQLYVNGWGAYDTGASSPNGSPRWRDTRTYVRVTDGNGNVLVPQSGDAKSEDGQFAILNGGPGPPGYNEDHTWNYKNDLRAGTVNVHVIRKWHHRNGTNYDWQTGAGQDNTNTYNCFSASCDLSVQGNVVGRSNGVQSGSGFNITAHVHNFGTPEGDDPLPAVIGGRPLILSSTSSPVGFWYNPAAPSGMNRGADEWNTWDVNEPWWNIGSYGVNATLYYDFDPTPGIQGGDLVLANCSPASYDVYKQFSLGVSSSVDLSPSVEDPNRVTYTGRADAVGPYGIPGEYGGHIQVDYGANARRQLYGGPEQVINSQSGRANTPVVYQWSMDPRPNHAGDKYFMNNNDFCVSETNGWIGPSNQFSGDTYGSCAQGGTQYIYDRPYLHAYGTDVISGSNFKNGDTCDTTGSSQTISAFRSTDPSKGGSGTQFAALALNQISGFRSASTNGAGPTELAFANTVGTSGGGSDQPSDGGFYQGQSICTDDFYGTQESPNTYASASVNINTSGQIQDGKQTLYARNGATLTINSNGTDFNKKAFIYVDGNVIINNNITFQPGKYLAIIAKGNIYIKNTVTRLDGLYVAQPRDSSNGGTIYTCASGTNDIGLSSRYVQCRSQLVINGAFAAKYVKLHRVANSLRDSTNRETPSNFSDGSGTKAAEIFNFSPEIYLYTPVFDDVTTGDPAQYYTTLPPVL